MALTDSAVFTAATGYVFTGPVGTAAPTPEQLKDFDPDTFGAGSYTLDITSTEDDFKVKVTVGDSDHTGQTTDPISKEASAAEIQEAIGKLSNVGSGNVVVKDGTDAKKFTVYFVGALADKNAVLEAGAGATAVNIAAKDVVSGWSSIGHTAEEDLPEFGYEGGDKETKGSWQRKTLREVTTENPVDYVTVKCLQFDNETLELYYGKNASNKENVFGVNGGDSPAVERAVLIVMVDGSYKIAFSAAKASTRRDEAIALAKDEFSVLPIRATFVKHPGRHLFEWIKPAK